MKKLIAVCAIMGATASFASAETTASAFSPYIGAEHAIEAEKSKLYIGGTTSMGMFGLKLQANMQDTASTDWSYTGLDLDISTKLGNGATLFLNNDLDDEFSRTESTLGIKWSF